MASTQSVASSCLLCDLPDSLKFVILNFLTKRDKANIFIVNKEFSEKILDSNAWKVLQFCNKYRIPDKISDHFRHNIISANSVRINQPFEIHSVHQEVFEYLAQNTVANDISLCDHLFPSDETTATQFLRIFENKRHLKSLGLYKMGIGPQSCSALIETLPKVPIKCLSLVGQRPNTLTTFIKSLGNITSLTQLSLRDTKLHGELNLLVDSLNSISSISILDLSFNRLDYTDMEQWRLCTNTSITSLNFDQNSIFDQGIAMLADWIHPKLTNLMLSCNNIHTKGAQILASVHKKFPKLILKATGNPVCNMGAFDLAVALKTTTQRELYLGGAIMDDCGFISIISILYGSSLQLLSIDCNTLGDNGMPFLAHFLKNTTTLKTLDLHNNKISISGGQILRDGLSVNSSLTKLNLGYNNISDIGAMSIAEALEKHPSIRSVHLDSNSIGDKGAIALGNILPCANIQTLHLSHNKIGERGHIAIAKGLRHSKCSNLCIWGNSIKASYLYLDLYRYRNDIYIDICEC
jgi:Ran GTPase-activating protein (RanGAP) involved in mRNA processing and transport